MAKSREDTQLKEDNLEKYLNDNYKDCMTHIMFKRDDKFFKARKDDESKEVAKLAKSFKDQYKHMFNFCVVDTTNELRAYITWSSRLKGLISKLADEFEEQTKQEWKIENGQIVGYEQYKEVIENIKKEICRKEGIEYYI